MGKLTALGANIFAGLFTYGVKQAGFDVLAQLEHGPYGVATTKLNFPKLDVRVGRENWNEKDFKNKVDFMFCNPPCAAFSTAGKGNWREQSARLRYIYDCAEAGIALKPKAWAWESVTQAWGTGQEFVLQIAEMWNDVGYHVTVLLQDNQYLGAPQVRRRMFFIAHKHPLVWPKFTKPMSVREALKKVAVLKVPETLPQNRPLSPLWKKLTKQSKNHGGYLSHALKVEGRQGLKGGTPSVMVRRLQLDKPAPVMIAASLRLHPTETRYMNWYEWLTLCGLPLSWKTAERSIDAACSELARAVMPPVGEWLANAVKKGLDLPALKTRPTTRLVNFMKPDEPIETTLFTYDGPTIKAIVPPPLPALEVKAPRAGRPARTGGPSRPGSGQRMRELIMKGLEADAILKAIHKEFPGSKASKADVSWNKGRLRREGKKVKS